MSRTMWSLMAACLFAASALSTISVSGMPGSGSPSEDNGHGGALFNPLDSTAVFYPPGAIPVPSQCRVSPTPIPYPGGCAAADPRRSSPFWGTPLPSGLGGPQVYQTPNACGPAPPTYIIPGLDPTMLDPTPLKPSWSPIESLTNLRAASPNQDVLANSIGHTPFVPPTYNPPGYNNPYNPANALGSGRFHLDNQNLVTEVSNAAGSPTPSTLFTANGDPHDAEGAPDTSFVLLGHDGYILGQFEAPVYDGPGYDFQVNTVFGSQPLQSTMCLYGATSATGPFTLVHSAFLDSSACAPPTSSYCPTYPGTAPCPSGEYCWMFDLRYFYTPLRTLAGEPTPDRLDYFMALNVIQHTPHLKADFIITPDNSASCHEVPSVCPDETQYPAPLRPMTFDFTDNSTRFGYPLWMKHTGPQNDFPPFPPYAPDITLHTPDPIVAWDWDFSSDPWNRESVTRENTSDDRDESHRYISPGIFPACHSVHTSQQHIIYYPQTDPPTPPIDYLAVQRQSDPPLSEAGLGVPPDPQNMFCKYVTVWNLPPQPEFYYYPDSINALQYHFVDQTIDPDWLMPDLDCPTCPPDGIQLREWDFTSDGIVDYTWTFQGTPYNPATDAPTYTYPMPGEYLVSLRVCDHDYLVSTTPADYGGLVAVYGDPLGPAHACNEGPGTPFGNQPLGPRRIPLVVPNHPPHLSVPPHFTVLPNQLVVFTVRAKDIDNGQTMTLRLCDAQTALLGTSNFAPVTTGGHEVQQTFSWRVDGGLGKRGPICFEVSDGTTVVRGWTSIHIVTSAQDTDLDGVVDIADNCPHTPNFDQLDSDHDGVGDACQESVVTFQFDLPKSRAGAKADDRDGDGLQDPADNCWKVPNAGQEDLDGDGVGDACDLDTDGDDYVDAGDNCPLVPNPLQADADADGRGDLCPLLTVQPKPESDRPLQSPVQAARSEWMLILGTALGILAMGAVLVPLLMFALGRARRGGKE